MNQIPPAEPIAIEYPRHGHPIVKVQCPYCQRQHQHRVRTPSDAGCRAAPCGQGEYHIRARNPDRNDGDEHILYRFRDSAGELLYVGITKDPSTRFRSHRSRAPWWQSATEITMTRFPNRAALMAAEIEAIKTENPKHNVAYAETATPEQVSKRSSNSKRGTNPFPDASSFTAPDAIACDDEPEEPTDPQPPRTILPTRCPDCFGRNYLEHDGLVRCDDCRNMWLYDEWAELVGLRPPRAGA